MTAFLAGLIVGANLGAFIMALIIGGVGPKAEAQPAWDGSQASIAAMGALIITINAVGWPWLAGWI